MEFILLSIIFLFAGIAAEVVGFGISAISMAFLPLIVSLTTAVPVVAIVSAIATGSVAYTTKAINLNKYLIPLFIGSILGIPSGLYILKIVPQEFLLFALGIILILTSVYSLIGKQIKLEHDNPTGFLVGFVAGLFGGAINVNGPIVGMYYTQNEEISKLKNKDLITTYMFVTGLVVILGHFLAGRINREVINYSLLAIPSLIIGMAIGRVIFKKVPVKILQIIIYLFVLGAGLKLIF